MRAMATTYFSKPLAPLSRALNTLALAGITLVLGMAFYWQLAFNEIPCPLCLLQRVAFVMVGMGFLMNVRYGPSPLHYGMVVWSALAGAIASGRQVLLHIAPGDTGYGSPFLGLHFYTWALVLFFLVLVFAGIMLMLDTKAVDQSSPLSCNLITRIVLGLFLLMVLGNLASTLLECGFGPCEDDPVNYLWLSLKGVFPPGLA